MCRAVLSIDKRFSKVLPRHPRGGPDGGRDMEALFRDDQLAFGAVGFVNQANDSATHKTKAKKKFADDLKAALNNEPKPKVFVFFTNVQFTATEKDNLVAQAKKAGLTYCDIFDRERIRLILDSTDGFAIRFQYLAIPLSDAEQRSFFARWGDDIQSVIATGFQQIEQTLARILFLQEANDTLGALTLRFELDRTYAAEEIGHFRAFCYMHLKEPKLRIFDIFFGSTDKSTRMYPPEHRRSDEPSGIKHGISSGQWESYITWDTDIGSPMPKAGGKELEKFTPVGNGSAIGLDPVSFVMATYRHDDSFIRLFPRISLRDINECWIMPVLNQSLAERIKAIHVYANGYKLMEIPQSEMQIDSSAITFEIPVEFSKEELADPWVRIRARTSSTFALSFFHQTPRRLFASEQTPDSLSK